MTDLGLTKPEVEGVKRTWALVEKNLEAHGNGILKALFENYPEYMKMFKFKDVTSVDQLEKNKSFTTHSKIFIKSLQKMVKNLEKKEALVKMLHENADKHHVKNVTVTHYTNTLALLPGYLAAQLGSHLDETAASGWGKVLKTMEAVIGARIQEKSKK